MVKYLIKFNIIYTLVTRLFAIQSFCRLYELNAYETHVIRHDNAIIKTIN